MTSPDRRKTGMTGMKGMTAARRALITVGALVMGYAISGALFEPGLKLWGVMLFLAAMVAGHDGVFLPLVIAAGAVMRRVGHLVRAAAVVSLAVTVVALPFVLGYGRDPHNPSALPLSYGMGLTVVLAGVWTSTLLTLLVRRVFRNRQNTVRIRRAPRRVSDG